MSSKIFKDDDDDDDEHNNDHNYQHFQTVFNETDSELDEKLESSTMETIEAIVQQLMVRQRAKLKSMEIEEIVAQQQSTNSNVDNVASNSNTSGQRNTPKTSRVVSGATRGNKVCTAVMSSNDVSSNSNHHRPHQPDPVSQRVSVIILSMCIDRGQCSFAM